MATVYEAKDRENDERRIAVKILRSDRSVDPESRARFQREVEILSDMDHETIVGILAFGISDENVPWLAMELISGETLGQRVRRDGAIAPKDLVPILSATCDALEAAHERNVVHRDLKPDNIFLPETGPPAKILDFGLSLSPSSEAKRLTISGSVIGTPRYMAPEQIGDASSADHRADIYAAGVIAYESLTGESPFTASDKGQLLGAILQNRLRPIRELLPDLPATVSAVLERAMSAKESRFQSAAEFAEAYAAALGVSSGRRQRRISTTVVLSEIEQALRGSIVGDEPLDPAIFDETEPNIQAPAHSDVPEKWPSTPSGNNRKAAQSRSRLFLAIALITAIGAGIAVWMKFG
jgi:serine/threonine protein kinase